MTCEQELLVSVSIVAIVSFVPVFSNYKRATAVSYSTKPKGTLMAPITKYLSEVCGRGTRTTSAASL